MVGGGGVGGGGWVDVGGGGERVPLHTCTYTHACMHTHAHTTLLKYQMVGSDFTYYRPYLCIKHIRTFQFCNI